MALQVCNVTLEHCILFLFLQADKEVAEGKLEAARPALEEAEAALNTIKSNDIALGMPSLISLLF